MPELTVVVPTFNERVNVEVLFAGLDRALSGIDFELIVVDDDSPDGTAEAARRLARSDRRASSSESEEKVWRRLSSRGSWHRVLLIWR